MFFNPGKRSVLKLGIANLKSTPKSSPNCPTNIILMINELI